MRKKIIQLFSNQIIKLMLLTRIKCKYLFLGSNIKIGKHICVSLTSPFFLTKIGQIVIHDNVKISSNTTLHCYGGTIEIGINSYIGHSSTIYGHGNVIIGNDCLIGMDCKLVSANHTIPRRSFKINSQGDKPLEIVIKNDVWLGSGVVVLPGVVIGTGVVIGAGSVVTKNIPDFAIAAGIPAKILKYRDE